MMALSKETKLAVMADFREWAGIGSSDEDVPEDEDQITVYCDYARDEKLDADDVREFLIAWMQEPETALEDEEE